MSHDVSAADSANPGVWVGLKRCGCCVAVVVDYPDRHTEQSKRLLLDRGLSVVYGTWAEWETTYRPNMIFDCGHTP